MTKKTRSRIKIGEKFGRLEVLSYSHNKQKHSYWLCRCVCGNEKAIRYDVLRSGNAVSCGCYRKEVLLDYYEKNTTHGKSKSRTYKVYQGMIQRCQNANDQNYYNYGGRGIRVCESWLESFEFFYKDMGEPPTDKHQIDRIDNNGDYSPENCRWVTPKENTRNRRTCKIIEYNGQKKCLTDWSTTLDIPKSTLSRRLKTMSMQDAVLSSKPRPTASAVRP